MTLNTRKHITLSATLMLFVAVLSCSRDRVPADVVDEQKMADLLKEAYLLEGFYAIETSYQYDTFHLEMIASYDSLLVSFDLTRDDFKRSLDWYVRHPLIYERVTDSVLARFDRELEAVNIK